MVAIFPSNAPPGGQGACKEYHNFKNFYSIVLMSMLDAKYRFVWGSCGFPGNSHDSIILQSTCLWSATKDGKFLPNYAMQMYFVSLVIQLKQKSAFGAQEAISVRFGVVDWRQVIGAE